MWKWPVLFTVPSSTQTTVTVQLCANDMLCSHCSCVQVTCFVHNVVQWSRVQVTCFVHTTVQWNRVQVTCFVHTTAQWSRVHVTCFVHTTVQWSHVQVTCFVHTTVQWSHVQVMCYCCAEFEKKSDLLDVWFVQCFCKYVFFLQWRTVNTNINQLIAFISHCSLLPSRFTAL